MISLWITLGFFIGMAFIVVLAWCVAPGLYEGTEGADE